MKKLLLVVLVIGAVVGISYVGAVAIDNHYQNYQNKKAPTEPVVAQKKVNEQIAAVKSAAVAEKRAIIEEFNGQVTECQKGKAAYDMLTAYQKTKVAAPVCGTTKVL